MQNKGFVKVFALLLTLVCVFYLSFSFVTSYHNGKAAKDPQGVQHYMDSMQNENVWLGVYSLKQCREMQIGLGLDLQGGMNVIMEVSVADVVKALSGHKSDAAFNEAVETAKQKSVTSQSDFITIFVDEYKRLAPESRLAAIFATQQLKDKVFTTSTDAEVEKVLRDEVKAAIDNSFNVLRTRIDRFGVVQPNIQTLEGSMGRIMIELPGVKEPERVRKLLQGSANLEFWETYNATEVLPALASIDSKLAAVAKEAKAAEKDVTEETKSEEVDVEAALTGEVADGALEDAKVANPLFALLVPNQRGDMHRSVVGIAHYSDTAAINAMINSPEAKKLLPNDLRLLWSVDAMNKTTDNNLYELYAVKSTQRNGRAALEGDVIVEAADSYDQYGNPCVTMAMNTDGSRR